MTNLFNPNKGILVNDRLLVKIPEIAEKTANGIYLTAEAISQERQGATKGELIKFSKNAFKDWEDKPKVGDIIYFHQYAGRVMITENVKDFYRNLSPKDVIQFELKE